MINSAARQTENGMAGVKNTRSLNLLNYGLWDGRGSQAHITNPPNTIIA